MYTYAQATVRNVIEDEIMVCDFEVAVDREIEEYILKELEEHYRKPLVRQDIPDTKMKATECLDMLALRFTEYSLDWLVMFVKSTILQWCVKRIKELEK